MSYICSFLLSHSLRTEVALYCHPSAREPSPRRARPSARAGLEAPQTTTMSSRLSTLTSAQRTAYQSLSIHPHPYARLPMGIRPGTGKRAPPSSDAMEVGRDGEAGGGHGHLRHGAQTVAAKGGRAQGSMAKRRKELVSSTVLCRLGGELSVSRKARKGKGRNGRS